mmetsp:Transcript_133094/g.332239  ORF Transcript_133094/g.332239 Transcript_133094/m.332239 type:complete len:442 (+) Transcript_133094:66-1391(+)
MSTVGKSAFSEDDDDEDAPILGSASSARKDDSKSKPSASSSSWQTLTCVMAFNLLLTMGALGSQGALLLKFNPVVDSVIDLQAKVTGLEATARKQVPTQSSDQSFQEQTGEKHTGAENLDLILTKLDTMKAQMVSAAQIDALKTQTAIAEQPALVSPEIVPGRDQDNDGAIENTQAQSPDDVQAPAMPDITGDDEYAQVLVYTGDQKPLGHKGEMHSQFGQDWLISSVLGCKRDGFFVDIAANDAEFLSNTLMLERDFGWNGACLEANRNYIYGLARRKCQTVIAAIGAPKNNKITFALRAQNGGIVGDGFDNKNASVKAEERVDLYLVEFGEILEKIQAPAIIDYMSLDVEGAETIVMSTFPWSKHTVRILNVERPKDRLLDLLESHGYQFLRPNKNGDQFWIHKSFPDLEQVKKDWGERGKFPAKTCMEALGYQRPGGL